MRFRIPELFLGSLLTIAVFAAGMSVQGSRNQPSNPQTAEEGDKANNAHKEHGSLWDWLTHDAAGFFTLWLVIVGSGQAGLFVWQLIYMRKGMDDAKAVAEAAKASAETAKEQVAITKMGVIDLERAYLSVGPTRITRDGIGVAILLNAHNTGRTAAFITGIYGEFSASPPLGENPIYEHGRMVGADFSMGAGEKATWDPYIFRTQMTGQHFFWGYVEYTDIFKNKRTTRFCAAIFPAGPQTPSGEIPLGKYQMAGTIRWREFD